MKLEQSLTPKSKGFIVTTQKSKSIPTIKCDKCLQHLSCYYNEIKSGMVVGEIVCPNCKTISKEIEIDTKYNKKINNAYLE